MRLLLVVLLVQLSGCAAIVWPAPTKISMGIGSHTGTAMEYDGSEVETSEGGAAQRLAVTVQPTQAFKYRRFDLGVNYLMRRTGRLVSHHGIGLEGIYYIIAPSRPVGDEPGPDKSRKRGREGRGGRLGLVMAAHTLIDQYSGPTRVGASLTAGILADWRSHHLREQWKSSGGGTDNSDAWVGDVGIGVEALMSVNRIWGETFQTYTLNLSIRLPMGGTIVTLTSRYEP